jgi:hypothetical protein
MSTERVVTTSTDASAALDRNQLSVQRMQPYVQLAMSEGVARDVAQSLDLDLTGDESALQFKFKSMAFTITGRVLAEPADVVVEMDLPFAAPEIEAGIFRLRSIKVSGGPSPQTDPVPIEGR